ncbi:T9SS type A sorting domain-containing protein [Chryseobacterium sp. MA9]|uniref:T9SS type A sorting domain-containing protein n=1 Tax=Chryseobacterium sp. MA9 TaxID=2966625 RepID=UPI0021051846|nr:T9SS type A sorting domain-containing protein [Chryseobacterium sp. MA9]UTX47492.1 T9SS type A sorting domain-containing protein [Chryseobacterium sp. MA9]
MLTYATASNINLTPYANTAFKLRFVYDDVGDYSFGVAVDNVTITGGVLATSEVVHADRINVYPNPVRDNIHIKLDSQNKLEKVSVVDMSGKLIKTFDKESDAYDLSDIPKGSYIIIVKNNNKEVLKKKIIKK